MITARSTPNIALIKYWGNRNNELRLPMADSLSMTLDTPEVIVSGEQADRFSVESFEADGSKRNLTEHHLNRFRAHRDLTIQYLHETVFDTRGHESLMHAEHWPLWSADFPKNVALTIRSQIPSSIGLASSAAIFSAVAEVYAGLIAQEHPLTREEISVIARLGSGSAARSIFGGFVALRNRATHLRLLATDGQASNEPTSNADIAGAFAEQIAPESHWLLHDIVIIPSEQEKKVGSTEGHALAHTSPLYGARVAAIPRRMQECTDAILHKDFEKLQRVVEEDALDMHEVMRTSTPSLDYLSEDTHRILRDITALREAKHIPVLYTMDAGPTVHLICTQEGLSAVQDFAKKQKGCKIFETKIGKGSHILS